MTDVDALVRKASANWDAHRFFEVHEELEVPWQAVKHEKKAEPAKDPRRDLIHAVILFAAAYVHWQRGNALGVTRKLKDARHALAATSLRKFAGVDWTDWLREVEAHLSAGAAGRPFDAEHVPRFPTR